MTRFLSCFLAAAILFAGAAPVASASDTETTEFVKKGKKKGGKKKGGKKGKKGKKKGAKGAKKKAAQA